MSRFRGPAGLVLHCLCLGASCAAILAAGPFPSENVTLLSQVSLEDFPGAPIRGNDCWGYVSPSGREYALMGLYNEVAVVEVTNPSAPVIIAEIPHTPSNWADIKVWQDHAYAVNESGGGMDVIDLSQVDQGIVTLVQRVTVLGLQTTHNLAIDTTSGFLYLCDANINGGRLVAFDLSDPANPVVAGQMNGVEGTDAHDAQVVTYTSGPYAGRQIAFASVGGEGLDIYDVTDKQNMFRLSRSTYPNLNFAHQAWTGDLQYLYLNDELDGINESVIFDISDLAAPVFVGTYSAGIEAIDHNQYVHDGFIYESDYSAGLRIFDAADPVNPVEVGWFDVYPDSDAAATVGTWSNYPFFPSGNVLISAKEEGLFVVRPGPPPIAFSYPGGLPDRIDPDGDTFLVEIVGVDGQAVDPTSARLHYDSGAGFVEAAMTPLGGDLFEASFAPLVCPELIPFYVSATTASGITIRDPISAPSPTFLAIAGEFLFDPFQDDMETDLGWTVGAPGDSASSGVWTRVDPNGNDSAPESDHSPDPARFAFVTGQEPENSNEGDNDVDDGTTTLLSPVFDLSDADDVTISYWRWYSNDFAQIDGDEGGGPNQDIFTIDISNDNGMSWVNVETIGPAGPGTSGGWILHSFNATDLVAPTSEVVLRFVASDLGTPSVVEAGIDDLEVVKVVCGVLDCNSNTVADDDELAQCPASDASCQDCNGNGLLDECDSPFPQQGGVALDAASYACGSTLEVTVSDCGPNLDGLVTDTISAEVSSDSDPLGEVVALTETGTDTGVFRGTVSLDTSGGAGIVQVGEGDTVVASYVDADDGLGGIDVQVTELALVDCAPPAVSNVQSAPGAFGATITFDTDEPASSTLRYGTACNALDMQVSEPGPDTTFSLPLGGLTEETVYFFAIDVSDELGNAASFDNGGLCYAFQTTAIPNYYTEHFAASDNDLATRSLLFTPDGSADFYSPCRSGITELPTDPSGGIALRLELDDFVTVALPAGVTVSLYGRVYDTFYVGSNGYVTFESGDTEWSETLADHFSQPRISAHFDDLDPRNQGLVSWRLLGDRVAVTWEDIPEYLVGNSNTFQIEMFFDGRVQMSYLAMGSSDGLAGLSDGTGLLPGFVESDLSAFGECALEATPPEVPGDMIVRRLDAGATSLALFWDDSTCPASTHQLLFGGGSGLPGTPRGTFTIGGSVCDLGSSAPFSWSGTPDPTTDPTGLIWWLLVATEGATEGSWGPDGSGVERNGPGANGSSGLCGVTEKDVSNLCGP